MGTCDHAVLFERAPDRFTLGTAASTGREFRCRDSRERRAGIVVEASTTRAILGVLGQAVNPPLGVVVVHGRMVREPEVPG